jgi:hypothetical protein
VCSCSRKKGHPVPFKIRKYVCMERDKVSVPRCLNVEVLCKKIIPLVFVINRFLKLVQTL